MGTVIGETSAEGFVDAASHSRDVINSTLSSQPDSPHVIAVAGWGFTHRDMDTAPSPWLLFGIVVAPREVSWCVSLAAWAVHPGQGTMLSELNASALLDILPTYRR